MSVPEPPRPRWQKRLLVACVVGSLSILLGVIGGTVLVRGGATSGGGGKDPSPSPTVPASPADPARHFLESLAAGDAEAAKAEVAELPADVSMLTDAALTAALAETPITEVNVPPVTDVEPDAETASIPVSYLIGDERVNRSFDVTRADGTWKVVDATTEVDLSSVRSAKVPMLINGAEVKADSITVFPGRYEFTTGLDTIDYGDESTLFVAYPSSSGKSPSAGLSLTGVGTKAFTDGIDALMDDCLESKSISPKGCPFSYSPGYQEKVTKKSIKWSWASRPNYDPGLDFSNPWQAKSTTTIEVKLTATGTQDGKKTKISETVSNYVTFTADVTAKPLKIRWG